MNLYKNGLSQEKMNEILSNYADTINSYLEKCYRQTTNDTELNTAVRYSLLGGGKRLRGALLLHIAELFSEMTSPFMPLVAAVESIHSYSLIHDDLPCMDNGEIRHGKPSCHIKFGEATALLAGDALLTNAFRLCTKAEISPDKIVRCIALLSDAAGIYGMVKGQLLDCSCTNFSQNELEYMHSLKTGRLISAAIGIGAIAGGADEYNVSQLMKFGSELGVCYQIIDDILDVTASEDTLGKSCGSDEKNNKITYVSLLGVEQALEIAKQKSSNALDILHQLQPNTLFLQALTRSLLNRCK